ncbi:hypothetical protein ABI_37470 [Asticcacaulis biprosthecium C19]|uniref:STAS/SEC14 domain-containing protein n=1 Tax=Asticcacaulis biprosthecium C19 TaxID=715226 RepID=F4QR78_9CAUL|nr:hypothetical protein [Asticcacaulis biprosthecium]EGF90715.1 hypothetical protein ABI_37470 [Asticcacaulis biprosthecium C19]
MPKRSRISLNIDAANRILFVRLHSLCDDHNTPDLIDSLSQVDESWSYDALFDFRRYEADLSGDYLSFLTQKWTALTEGRDRDRRMALVSPCPVLNLQLREMRSAMPDRGIAVFESFDEGLDWLKADTALAA